MFERLSRIGMTIVATLAVWFSVAMIDVITGDPLIRNFAAILAFIFMLIAWLLILSTDGDTHRNTYFNQPDSDPFAKTKRTAPDSSTHDSRLALLLELLDEDERRDLKARLVDDLSMDGELSLADVLAVQDDDTAYHAKT